MKGDTSSNPSRHGSATELGRLRIQHGQGRASFTPLLSPQVRIGRSPLADVVLDHASVSRQHTELVRNPFGRWWVHDLKSVNGTWVNGGRVEKHALLPSDLIQVGEYTLSLSPPDTPAAEDSSDTVPLVPVRVAKPDAAQLSITTLNELHPPVIHATHISVVLKFGQELATIAGADLRLQQLCTLMVSPEFKGWMAQVLRLPAGEGAAEPRALGPAQFPKAGPNHPPYISASLLKAVQKNKDAMIGTNVGRKGGVIGISLPPTQLSLAALACPLRVTPAYLDVLYVVLPPHYGTGEWLAIANLAVEEYQRTEAALAARRFAASHSAVERDLAQAREIQMRTVPANLTQRNLEAVVGFEPCLWVGGDFVAIIPVREGQVFLGIADVSGKGLQAALVTSGLHSMLHAYFHGGNKLGDIFKSLNEHLCRYLPEEMFVTFTGMLLDPASGQWEGFNAGHPPPFLLAPAREPHPLELGDNLPLGVKPMSAVGHAGKLAKGDMLVFYSDGVNELANEAGDLLGLDQLGRELSGLYAALGKESVGSFAARFTGWLDHYRGPALAQDDRTFLLVRRR